MSESKVKANDSLLLADVDSNAVFKPLACLEEHSLSSSLTEIDASSLCGNEYVPGDKFDDTITGSGFAIKETGTPAKESYDQLKALYNAKTIFPVIIGKASRVAGDKYLGGNVFISSLNQTTAYDDVVKFDITLRIVVPPISLLTTP